MKTLDLKQEQFQRRPKMPAVITPRSIEGIPGVKGKLPLRAGEVVLTPTEARKLDSMGWAKGDPIPGDLAARFKQESVQIRREIDDEIRNTPVVPLDTPRTVIPPEVDINSLDSTKRAEIEEYLKNFKKVAPQINQSVKLREDMGQISPSVQKAIVALEDEGIELVDSRVKKAIVGDTAESFQRKIDAAEGKVDTNQPIEDLPVSNIPYDDKVRYLTAIMAGQRFNKTYYLFGDKLTLTFTQLSSKYSEMIMKQLAFAARSNKLLADEGIRLGYLYRMLLSLDSITLYGETTNVSQAVTDFFNDMHGDTEDPTALPELVVFAQNAPPLNNESLWRICQDCHKKFNALIESLEAEADNSDFWQGIED